jgi:hypothetical protein
MMDMSPLSMSMILIPIGLLHEELKNEARPD